MDNNELMHYGVLGMKWGKRKAYDPTSRGGSITRKGSSTQKTIPTTNNAKRASKIQSNNELISQTERYAARQSTGKNVAKRLLLGFGGTTTYNMARSMGYSRGKSAVRAFLDLNASEIASLAAGTGANLAAMKKNGGDMETMTKGQRLASRAVQLGTNYGVDYALRKSGRAGSLQQRRMMKEYQSRNR